MERNKSTILKNELENLYQVKRLSVAQISKQKGCSENKVNYWLRVYGIKKRTISEAVYISYNANGDPFRIPNLDIHSRAFLYGLGCGLYWGGKEQRAIKMLLDWGIRIQI